MDMLERYVSAVRSFLPKGQQDDIAKELSENLQSQMDDQEAELGRPLTEAEQEAIFRQLGHPMVVAGRYQPNQVGLAFGRKLISPALFPFYLRVLWFDMGITLAIFVIALFVLPTVGIPISADGWKNSILLQIFIQFGSVTAIFALIDHYLPTMTWNAQKPPTLPPAFRQDLLNLSRQPQPVPRLESIAQIVALVVLLPALRLLFNNPSVFFGAASDTYQIGTTWQQVIIPSFAIYGVFIAQAIINLIRPDWARFRLAARLVADLTSLGIVIYLLQANNWVVLVHPDSGSGNTLNTINQSVFYGLLAALLVVILAILINAWKLIRGERKRRA